MLRASRAYSLASPLGFQWVLTTGGGRKAVNKGWQLGRWTGQWLIRDWTCTQGGVAINLTHICPPYSSPLKVSFPKAHSHYSSPWIYDYFISKVNSSLPSGSAPKPYKLLGCSEQKHGTAGARLPVPSQAARIQNSLPGTKGNGIFGGYLILIREGWDEGEGDRMGERRERENSLSDY